MIKRSFFTSIIVCFVSLLVLAESAPADLMNGDFSADFSGNTDPALGWAVTAGPVDWFVGVPPVGSSIDVPAAFFKPDPDEIVANSTLSQMITVDPGFSALSFDIFMTTDLPTESDTFTASLGTQLLYTLPSSALIGDGEVTFAETLTYDVSSFISTGPVKLEFNLAHDYNDGGTDALGNEIDSKTTVLLDNVKLTPIPSTIILGSLGLTFSGWLLKRKRMI